MAVVWEEEFDGAGAEDNGAVTADLTAFDSIYGDVGTITFSDTHVKSGTMAARVATSGAASVLLERDRAQSAQAHWSFYIYPLNLPGSNAPVFWVGSGGQASNRTFQVTWNADGTIKGQNSDAVRIGPDIGPLPLGQWSRVDVSLVGADVEMSVFLGSANCDDPPGSAPEGNVQSATLARSDNIYVYFGLGVSTAAEFYLDAIREGDTGVPLPVGGGTINPDDPPAVVQWRRLVFAHESDPAQDIWDPPLDGSESTGGDSVLTGVTVSTTQPSDTTAAWLDPTEEA